MPSFVTDYNTGRKGSLAPRREPDNLAEPGAKTGPQPAEPSPATQSTGKCSSLLSLSPELSLRAYWIMPLLFFITCQFQTATIWLLWVLKESMTADGIRQRVVMYEVKGNSVIWGTGTLAKQPKWMAPIVKFNVRNGRELKIERVHLKGENMHAIQLN